ncbi:MAG: S8 family serine peptidase [Coriobacteriales bacterium]|nr:S8 family serine peptidase [Coriobacteriales bacterium]
MSRETLKRICLCLLGSVLAVFACSTVAFAGVEYVPGEIIIVYEDQLANASPSAPSSDPNDSDDPFSVSVQSVGDPVSDSPAAQLDELGFTVQDELPSDGEETGVVAQVPQDMSVEDAVATAEQLPGVAYAQPNYVYHLIEPMDVGEADVPAPNDTFVQDGRQFNLSLANVLGAWDLCTTNGSVSVAVIDSGCRLTHVDLVGCVDTAHAWDFSGSRNQPLVTSANEGSVANGGDANGHGTHVCGIIGANVDDDLGVAGISHGATVIPICVLDSAGKCYSTDLYEALAKVRDLHRSMPSLRVVNMSLGGSGNDSYMESLISELASEGVLCVCAAGNDDSAEQCIPADCADALSVMALDANGRHTWYTNYKTGASINTTKTVSAVGGNAQGDADRIISTADSGDCHYTYMSGTSQATPLVSGVASLVWAANPSLSVADVKGILTRTAVPVDSSASGHANKDAASAGAINAFAAVAQAQGITVFVAATPAARRGLVYTGSEQVGIAASDAYVVRGTTRAVNAGTYKATVTPNTSGGYMWANGTTEAITVTWSIAPASLAGAKIDAIGQQTRTGSAITPTPAVRWSGRTLARGTDYRLSYANNVNAGTAKVTATGMGNFTGSTSTTFSIVAPKANPAPSTPSATAVESAPAPDPHVSYRTHVQRRGWQGYVSDGSMSGTSGKSLRLEGINISLADLPYSGGIQYRTHVQRIGWQGWRKDGKMAGTSGKSYRLEAIRIQLYGEMAEKYDVYYRVHAQRLGWMGWAKNGAQSGTAGYSYRLEGIQIVLVPKGQSGPGATFKGIGQRTSRAFVQKGKK